MYHCQWLLIYRYSQHQWLEIISLAAVQFCVNDKRWLIFVLCIGMRNRQTGSHGLNEFSSRSHSMLTLTIDTEQQDPDDENLYLTKRGKLTFVDLAGNMSTPMALRWWFVSSSRLNCSLFTFYSFQAVKRWRTRNLVTWPWKSQTISTEVFWC